jgi:hypothetical protein
MKNVLQKVLIISAVFTVGAQAQGISVDLMKLGHAVKQMHGHVTSATEWRRATGAVLASADIIDWRTTYIGVVNGVDCEDNPVFQTGSGACHKIDKPKFNFVKGLILGILAAEEITPKLPHADNWSRSFTIANVAMAAVLIPVDISNIHVLVTQK